MRYFTKCSIPILIVLITANMMVYGWLSFIDFWLKFEIDTD
jgi:hypothetical protein